MSFFQRVSQQPFEQLLGGPIATTLLMGANIAACASEEKLTSCCVALAIGAKLIARQVGQRGWWLLGATGTFYAARQQIGPSIWTDVPVAVAGVALCLKRSEGIAGWSWLHEVRLRPDAAVYTSRIQADKVLVGAAVLLLNQQEQIQGQLGPILLCAAIGMSTIAGLIGVGCATRYVRYDPHPPNVQITLAWAAVNLLLVAVSEEALFRGVALRALHGTPTDTLAGQFFAVVVTSVLFGIAHKHGGPTYVGLSTVAGLGYGAVVAITGRIEAGILLHAALNLCHFLGYSYPFLDPHLRRSKSELTGR